MADRDYGVSGVHSGFGTERFVEVERSSFVSALPLILFLTAALLSKSKARTTQLEYLFKQS